MRLNNILCTSCQKQKLQCAKHPDRTQQFLDATQIALETFEDEISSLTEEIREKAYRNYVKTYKEALVPIWNLARFADIRTVLKTVTDKNINKITTMAERLKPTPPHPKAITDKADSGPRNNNNGHVTEIFQRKAS